MPSTVTRPTTVFVTAVLSVHDEAKITNLARWLADRDVSSGPDDIDGIQCAVELLALCQLTNDPALREAMDMAHDDFLFDVEGVEVTTIKGCP